MEEDGGGRLFIGYRSQPKGNRVLFEEPGSVGGALELGNSSFGALTGKRAVLCVDMEINQGRNMLRTIYLR